MRKCLIAPEAREDIHEILAYIRKERLSAAIRLRENFEKKWQLLREFPKSGPRHPEFGPSVRILVVGNYVIFYRLIPDGVLVTQVCDGRCDLPKVFRGILEPDE